MMKKKKKDYLSLIKKVGDDKDKIDKIKNL